MRIPNQKYLVPIGLDECSDKCVTYYGAEKGRCKLFSKKSNEYWCKCKGVDVWDNGLSKYDRAIFK